MGEKFHGPVATKSDKLDMTDTPYNSWHKYICQKLCQFDDTKK